MFRTSAGPVQETASHAGMKDSKVVWVGEGEGRLLTSGFGADRARELILRDIRNIKTPQKVSSIFRIIIIIIVVRCSAWT